MRVVLDTNVIISATLIHGGNEDQILRAWRRGAFDLVLSPAIIEEISRVLLYERLRRSRWMTEGEIAELLEALAASSFIVTGRIAVKASRDPDDDKFLAAAIQGEARFLVTGDRDLLDIGGYGNFQIITPARFLRTIRTPLN
jgi:putative PIN family toxin of toxin-antitoxin system